MVFVNFRHRRSARRQTGRTMLVIVDERYRRAEARLNAAYAGFRARHSSASSEPFLFELTMHALIFQYEVATDLKSFVENRPEGFARNVALKGLVHKLVEFDKTLMQALVPDMIRVAERREIPFSRNDVSAVRKQWRSTLQRITAWNDVRNKATGHYDRDIALHVDLVERIDVADVVGTVDEYFAFNHALVRLYREAGLPTAAE
jgi:hypothetical protein